MEITSDTLAWLHDGQLLGVALSFSGSLRNLTVTARFDRECGRESVAGKLVVLSAKDVILLKSRAFGAMANAETIDFCELAVSHETAAELTKWLQMGGRKPKAHLTLFAHSGSFWEVMCESLSIRLL